IARPAGPESQRPPPLCGRSGYETDPGCRFQAGPQFHTGDPLSLCCPWGTNKIKQLGTGVVGLEFSECFSCAEEIFLLIGSQCWAPCCRVKLACASPERFWASRTALCRWARLTSVFLCNYRGSWRCRGKQAHIH